MPTLMVDYRPGITFQERIYLDASFLAEARDRQSPKHIPASKLLAELIAAQKDLFITNLVIDELCWALLRAYYRKDNSGRSLNAQMIKQDASIIARYHNGLWSVIQDLLKFDRLIIASDRVNPREIVTEAMNLMGSELLMPRDSFHLAFITKLGIEGFVTKDNDFDNLNIPSTILTIYKF